MKIRAIPFLAFLICLIGLTIIMLIPNLSSPHKIKYFDKIAHLGSFAVLSTLLLLSVKKMNKNITVLIFCFCLIVYGFFIEYFQGFTGRTSDIVDFLSDIAGVVAGCFIYFFVKSFIVKND